MSDTITFTKEKFLEFKESYEKFKKYPLFIFEGRPVLLSYAKYVIEFLEPQFKDK